jgi:hypothetical protein
MAKYMPDAVIDSMLDILGAATRLCICSTQPTTYTEAETTYKLAIHTLTGGDFSKANGDTSGRKLILAAQNGISVDADGVAAHYALTVAGATLLLVGTISPTQQVYIGNQVNFPATDVDEIRDYA